MSPRALIWDTFRKKSPFEGLLEHVNKVKDCISLLETGIAEYVEMDYTNFEDISKKVSKIEHEADLIKGNIRAHLPRSILMPIDKRHFLWILREQDSILDHAENLAQMLTLRHTKIPIKLKEDYKEHMHLVIETVEEMGKAVEKIRDLIGTGFTTKERNETKELIKRVHVKEWEADTKRYDITKKIYRLEDSLSPMDMYHLLKMTDWIDDIADHAENVVDWLRAAIAK